MGYMEMSSLYFTIECNEKAIRKDWKERFCSNCTLEDACTFKEKRR
jgi:hypothetical protein